MIIHWMLVITRLTSLTILNLKKVYTNFIADIISPDLQSRVISLAPRPDGRKINKENPPRTPKSRPDQRGAEPYFRISIAIRAKKSRPECRPLIRVDLLVSRKAFLNETTGYQKHFEIQEVKSNTQSLFRKTEKKPWNWEHNRWQEKQII